MEKASLEKCIIVPPKINSMGISGTEKYAISSSKLPLLELQIALILSISHLLHSLLKKLGFPIFTSQIIVRIHGPIFHYNYLFSRKAGGFALSYNSVIRQFASEQKAGLVVGPVLRHKLFEERESNTLVLGTIAGLGFGLFIFQSAVKTDLRIIKNAGIRPLSIGLISMLVPTIIGVSATYINKPGPHPNVLPNSDLHYLYLILSATYAMTSFPVVAMQLEDLKILNSELGRLGLSTALASDLIGLTLYVVAILGVVAKTSLNEFVKQSGCVLGFVLVVAFILRPAMTWVVRNTPDGTPVKEFYVYVVFFGFLVALAFSYVNPVFIVVFPLVLGLAVPDGPPLGSAVASKFEYILFDLLMPICIATFSMRFDFLPSAKDIGLGADHRTVLHYAFICIAMSCLKFIVCLILARLLCKIPTKDAAALALVLNSKGIVDLGLYSITYDLQTISISLYIAISTITIVVATFGPVLVKLLYDPSKKYAGYQKRNIADMKPNSELQIVTCIHAPDDVTQAISLLDIICPNKENPIVVNVLHLVKLAGRASPLFISHQKQPKTISEVSYFQHASLLCYQFELNNWGAVSVNSYTAVSPASSMHEDTCSLALDKQASLILLPFHKRWYPDGTFESEDSYIRVLNSTILDRSPCSVGILVDRGHLSQYNARSPAPTICSSTKHSSFNVAMVFLGGEDDREALIFAKRISQEHKATLTVMIFKSKKIKDDYSEWNIMLDSLVLKDAKSTPRIIYMETEVVGGSETARILRSVAQEYDLVVVGRRDDIDSPQTSGLKEWSEFPELGVLGDLLASSDLGGTCSILVIQQQKQRC